MNKKQIIPLILGLIMIILYFSLRPIDIDDIVNPTSLSVLSKLEQRAIVSNSPSVEKIKEYGEEFQKKLFAELTGKEKLPKFEDFPAKVFSENKNITVDVNSDPIAREYRTAIRYGVERDEINFAGRYLIVEWGCGSGCQGGAMVDADTGHVYPLPGPMVSGFEAKKDSRLLIQNPLSMYGNWREWYRMCYWEWMENKFKLIGVYGVDFDKKKIVEREDDRAFCSIKQ